MHFKVTGYEGSYIFPSVTHKLVPRVADILLDVLYPIVELPQSTGIVADKVLLVRNSYCYENNWIKNVGSEKVLYG